jgi:putative ABC transport system permease protein
VGDWVTLDIEGAKQKWYVVGRVKTAFVGPELYANRAYLARGLSDVGRANRIQVASSRHDTEFQADVLAALESRFKQAGMRIQESQTSGSIREFSEAGYGIMIAFLMVMALMLAMVGGLGLMGTMGINVLERTREIGVMRAIGASNRAVMQNVLVEGILTGWASFALAAPAAVPLGTLLSDAVGMAFMQEKLNYVFSVEGALLWLGIVTVISALASYLPARRASRLTVREVLAYE